MIHTYFYDAKGVGNDFYSLNIHCHVARATGEYRAKWEYYNSIFEYDVSEEERILNCYQMCVLYENEENLFGFINYGTHFKFRDELARLRFGDRMSFLSKSRRRTAGRSRRVCGTIKLDYRQLEIDPDYGCYTFMGQGSVDFAERVKWIAEEFVVK
jgi:hypothetical protein